MDTFKKSFFLNHNFLIILVVILGFILRIITLDQSLWYDEAINVYYSTQHSFWSFVNIYPVGDFHPPLYFAVLWVFSHLFGTSEIIVRLPSVIFGTSSILIVYLLAKNLLSKKIALLSALLLAIAPLHIYYSQEARMYSLATLVVCLSFYFFERVLAEGKNLFRVGFIICNVLLLYSDYLPYLVFFSQFTFLLIERRDVLKQFIILYLISFLSLIVWVPIFLEQIQTGINAASTVSGWRNVVGDASIKEMVLVFLKNVIGRVSLENKYITGLLTIGLGILYGSILGYGLKEINRNSRILLYWIIIPTILAFLISFYIPVLSYFRLQFIWPAFLILLSVSVFALPKKLKIISIIFLVIISVVSTVSYYLNPKFQREDWKGLVSYINSQHSVDTLLIESNNAFAPLKYYKINVSVVPALEKVPLTSLDDINIVESNELYVLEYLVEINDPDRLVVKRLEELGFQVVGTKDFLGVGFLRHYHKL